MSDHLCVSGRQPGCPALRGTRGFASPPLDGFAFLACYGVVRAFSSFTSSLRSVYGSFALDISIRKRAAVVNETNEDGENSSPFCRFLLVSVPETWITAPSHDCWRHLQRGRAASLSVAEGRTFTQALVRLGAPPATGPWSSPHTTSWFRRRPRGTRLVRRRCRRGLRESLRQPHLGSRIGSHVMAELCRNMADWWKAI